jgi:hypothetical protein
MPQLAMSRIGQNTLSVFLMLTLVSASKADNHDSFAVFDGEDCVGHIMRTQKSPAGKPWFWTIFFVSGTHNGTADRKSVGGYPRFCTAQSLIHGGERFFEQYG